MKTSEIRIGERLVGDGHPVFVMAEAGANHNGDLSLAKELIVAAREAGADCVKFQTLTAKQFCADRSKMFTYRSQGKTVTESEYDMFERFEFSPDEWAEIVTYCRAQEITFLTTVQDPVNLRLMLELGLEGIKVGSDDFDHLVNLRQYAETGLPLIIAKGMSDLTEVDRVVSALRPVATGGLAVLHCISLYPAEARFLNLRQLVTLREHFPDVVWGFSDHSQGSLAPALAVTLGARIIEKHFTLDHDLAGPDHWFSADPIELRAMVAHVRFAEQALGDGVVKPSPEEAAVRQIMRRRILAGSDLAVGTVLGEENVVFKRAEKGVFAGEWEHVRGRALRVSKRENEAIEASEVDG